MKLTVKTLKGTRFEIQVQPNDTVMAVKKTIEESQSCYPWGQQLLIHDGKVLKDESTLEENKVSEDGFLVVMLNKLSTAPPASLPSSSNVVTSQALTPADIHDRAAFNQGSLYNSEEMIQQIVEMGGGHWDREAVSHALRAAYHNPKLAIEYLFFGIPEEREVAILVPQSLSNQASGQRTNTNTNTNLAGAAPLSGLPSSSPSNTSPRATPNRGVSAGGGSLNFLRNSQQFQTIRTIVQANPRILQPILHEMCKQNPRLLRLIRGQLTEFLQTIHEPHEGAERDLSGQAGPNMPHSVSMTMEEQEAMQRLEAMGFDRVLVMEAFLACDRNEELAAAYLLEKAGDHQE